MSNEICFACCRRLTDIYEFKLLIERSDMELQKTCQIKRIIFANIQDIKCKIEINENDSKYEKPLQSYITEKFVQSSKKTLNYKSTIINRLKMETPVSDQEKSCSGEDFLDFIKEDPDNENDNTNDGDVDYPESESDDDEKSAEIDDEDYKPIKKYSYNQLAKSNREKAEKQMMCIKPVLLRDIRVLIGSRSEMTPTPRKQSQWVCPVCGIMVRFPKAHMLTHTARKRCVKCDQCSKSFYNKSSLINHLKSHGNKDYQCDKCVATFYTIYDLKQHRLVHAGLLPRFPCDICGKTFRSKGHVWRHCQGVHGMGEKQFSCDQCVMTFVTKAKLNHHIRVHTRERPFKCEICTQPYSYKRDFNRHCLKKHGVFLKGRNVFVMNEEVMGKEKALMTNLLLKVNGHVEDDEPIMNPFEGPHALKAYEQAVKLGRNI